MLIINNFIKKLIKCGFNYLGYDIINTKIRKKRGNEIELKDLLELLFFKINNLENFFFIQIGANDGKSNDPLFKIINKYKLNGILVEPQKEIFDKLQSNYIHNDNLDFLNIAISKNTGMKKLYKVKNSYSDSYTGIASFSKEHVRDYLVKNDNLKESKVDRFITFENVKTLSFSDFIKNNKIEKVDLLQIDVEGYDYEIIKMINFSVIHPRIINYESKNLSNLDQIGCKDYLTNEGYTVFDYGGDTFAYDLSIN